MKIKTVLLISLMMNLVAYGQISTDKIESSVNKDKDKYISIFKDLHQNPELGFEETETAKFVADELRSFGYKVTENIGKTGIAAVLKNGAGPTVMYRADMDALPVQETTGVDWASTKQVQLENGTTTYVSHMCGHDAHITWMLQTAQYLAENKEDWKGTVVFIGQPAEELIEGARAMVDDGLYDKHKIPQPDYLFGMHTAPGAVGMVVAGDGPRLAGTDQFDVTFYGVGGHGSAPEKAIDPVVMAANAVMQYQTIVNRKIDPQHAAVLTVGSIKAGESNNVIPDKAVLKINLRWFDEEDRKILKENIQRINESIAYANNLPKDKYPTVVEKGWSYPLENNANLTDVIRKSINSIDEIDFILTEKMIGPTMGSEDFHHLVIDSPKKDTPYSYINIGIIDPDRFAKSIEETGEPPYYNHNGDYEVDLRALPLGSEIAIHSMLGIFEAYKK